LQAQPEPCERVVSLGIAFIDHHLLSLAPTWSPPRITLGRSDADEETLADRAPGGQGARGRGSRRAREPGGCVSSAIDNKVLLQ
jgi:hypothetical protein